MPYYERFDALCLTLESYLKYYGGDVEVVIVDDGSPNTLAEQLDASGPQSGVKIKIITLPKKAEGYSPVVPYNIGAEFASHDIIALTLPEVRHESPALYAMREQCTDHAYVMANCWCESMQRWLAKSDFEPPRNLQQEKPPGIAFNFLTMLRRDLWNEVGGMDRAYRWGSHYDDTDFAHKIKTADSALSWVDDVVIHTRANGARAPWVKGGAERNKQIFEARWKPVTS